MSILWIFLCKEKTVGGKNSEKMWKNRKLEWLQVAQKVPQDVATLVQDSSYFASFKHCYSDGTQG